MQTYMPGKKEGVVICKRKGTPRGSRADKREGSVGCLHAN